MIFSRIVLMIHSNSCHKIRVSTGGCRNSLAGLAVS